jgi:hypothetical protein
MCIELCRSARLVHPPSVLRLTTFALALLALSSLCVMAACGGAPVVASPAHVHTNAAAVPVVADSAAAPEPYPGHWYFERLSRDGKRALLRRLDGEARSTLQTRVVDVDGGKVVADDTFPELGKLPLATIGRRPNEVAELMGRLAAPAFADDLVRNAGIAAEFPFGACGRLSAAPQTGAIAFNAGDWLYVADDHGHVQKRLTKEAAYDPRFTPDGKNLLFRRATGTIDKVRAKYELFVMPTDLSAAPRVLAGTAGARDRFGLDDERGVAVVVASQEPQVKTCVLSVGLEKPFAVKKLGCLDGGEQLVDSTLSPSARWAAMTTQRNDKDAPSGFAWRLRVVSLVTGKVALDEAAEPGLIVRAISDAGLLVQSGARGVVVDDVEAKTHRTLANAPELGHRGFFRSATELVVVRGGSVVVVDLAKE